MSVAIAVFYALLLILIAVVDIRKHLILDKITYPAMAVVLLISILNPEIKALNSLEGGLLGFSLAFAIALSTAGKGMGMGDVKLATLIGLMVGFPSIIYVVVGSLILGGMVAIYKLRKTDETDLPFAPSMATAAILSLAWAFAR